MNTQTILVSVFIPTYNASSCIEETLKSVLSQTYSDIEVWIVDDCSTDDTVEILSQWQQRDTRVHVLSKDKNEGFVPFSWVSVFPHLKGEFTLYMSHDDFLSPDCIELLVRCQQKNDADAVIPDCVFSYDDGTQKSSFLISEQLSAREAFARMLNYDIPGFALWRTSLIKENGMPTDAWNSDEGMQRIWALNCKNGMSLCPQAKFFYRITQGSITKGLKPYHLTGLKTQKRLFNASIMSGICICYPKHFFRFLRQYLKSFVYLRIRNKLNLTYYL